MTTPTTLRAGDTYRQLLQPGDYSAADGWVMKQRFTPRAAGTPVEMTAAAEGDAHLFAVAPAGTGGTASWAAGEYTAVRWVEKDADVYTLAQWQLTITPNLRTATAGTDTRSLARRALDDAQAAYAAMMEDPTARRFKIGEREREFNSPADILAHITYWESQVAAEERLAGRREPVARRIYSRI